MGRLFQYVLPLFTDTERPDFGTKDTRYCKLYNSAAHLPCRTRDSHKQTTQSTSVQTVLSCRELPSTCISSRFFLQISAQFNLGKWGDDRCGWSDSLGCGWQANPCSWSRIVYCMSSQIYHVTPTNCRLACEVKCSFPFHTATSPCVYLGLQVPAIIRCIEVVLIGLGYA